VDSSCFSPVFLLRTAHARWREVPDSSDPSRSHNSDSLLFNILPQDYFSFLLVEIKSRYFNYVPSLRSQQRHLGYGLVPIILAQFLFPLEWVLHHCMKKCRCLTYHSLRILCLFLRRAQLFMLTRNLFQDYNPSILPPAIVLQSSLWVRCWCSIAQHETRDV
jgi:hypothetical protein